MKSLFKVSRQELARVLMHMPLGILAVVFGYWVGWWLAVIFTAGFLIYEVDEDWHIRNGAYSDIKGFLWGVGIGGVVMVILKLVGVL